MKETCLLIVTKDKRKFLTHESNLPYLIEFIKTFGSEVYKVQAANQKLLELKHIAKAICSQECTNDPNCVILKKIYPQGKKPRDAMIKNAEKIRTFIRERLLSKKEVSLQQLKNKYASLGITSACLCNHLSTVRKGLAREGLNIQKIGRGRYAVA